ncbi:MAG TPA: glycoside hydrolase family 18 protein [Bacteroidota bacterium]|nr:glycoside hydrolase family 18 protein [Bacteroidota bacterium]
MRRLLTILILIGAAQLPLDAQERRYEVVGYYPSWKYRTDTHLLTPAKIPFGMLTVINYAFFYPLPDGTITGRDPAGDATILTAQGADSGTDAAGTLTALAHAHGVRVLLSIGGWEDSGNFPSVAADAVSRARFARSCAAAISTFGFDGIDIDWEFPGFAEHNGTPADGKNYLSLLRVLRDTLDSAGLQSGRHLVLSAALPADRKQALAMEIRDAAQILDYLNIMTYDFYGPWDTEAYHNAPLYPGPGGDSARCVDGAFRLYTETFGIPASRINLGVPFYGHTFTDCTTLGGAHGPADTVHFAAGGAFYYAIDALKRNFTNHRDERARVPYLTSSAWNMLVSYDDTLSVAEKARYVTGKGARGLIIWEITGDYLPDGSHPLLEAIDGVFHVSH